MRSGINFSLLLVAAAWLIGATLPAGLNVCMQRGGKAQVGLGCSCDECSSLQQAEPDCSGNCCERQAEGDAFGERCCTCTRLAALHGIQQVRPEQPRMADAPAPARQIAASRRLMVARQLSASSTLLHPPPLLHRTEILQL